MTEQREHLAERFRKLSTPLVADACVRLGLPIRGVSNEVKPLQPGDKIAGQVLPAKHYGSVDIFLEAMLSSHPGDILVVDNEGRKDEGCIGDMITLEALTCKLAGIIVWGCHRDTAELKQIKLPLFSLGAYPGGPLRVDAPREGSLQQIFFSNLKVTTEDNVFADSDGVLFVRRQETKKILETAEKIWETEMKQAESLKAGKTLRSQLRFEEYLDKRSSDPQYTFRQHLREIGGAVEE